MAVEAEIEKRTDLWQLAIEARDTEQAAEFLSNDYALIILQPNPAIVKREEWLRMLPDYDVRSYSVEERIVDGARDVYTVFQRVDQTAIVKGADRRGIFVLALVGVLV